MFKTSIIAGVILFINSTIIAQNINKSKLYINDSFPEVKLNLINFPTSYATISDFKGKALILDFWATWCVPCIKAFPKIDSLNYKFRNQLLILPVTYENETTVRQVIDKMEKVNHIKLGTVISDTILSSYFNLG